MNKPVEGDAMNLRGIVDASQRLKPDSPGVESLDAPAGRGKAGESFSKILEDKEQALEESKKEKSKKEEAKRSLEERVNGPGTDLSLLHQYLYNLLYKDPSTLSLATRQALHLEAAQPTEQVGIHEFQRLLAARGVTLNSLSFSQIAAIASLTTRSQLVGFLDRLARSDGTPDAPEQAQKKLTELLRGGEAGDRAGLTEEQMRKDLMDQIVRELSLKVQGVREGEKGKELVLKLHPASMGAISVKVGVKDGKVSASFACEVQEVREMLQAHLPELKESMARKRVRLQDVTIS